MGLFFHGDFEHGYTNQKSRQARKTHSHASNEVPTLLMVSFRRPSVFPRVSVAAGASSWIPACWSGGGTRYALCHARMPYRRAALGGVVRMFAGPGKLRGADGGPRKPSWASEAQATHVSR